MKKKTGRVRWDRRAPWFFLLDVLYFSKLLYKLCVCQASYSTLFSVARAILYNIAILAAPSPAGLAISQYLNLVFLNHLFLNFRLF